MGEHTISLKASAIQAGADWSDRHNDLRSREHPMGSAPCSVTWASP
jgi:hypothetical protein